MHDVCVCVCACAGQEERLGEDKACSAVAARFKLSPSMVTWAPPHTLCRGVRRVTEQGVSRWEEGGGEVWKYAEEEEQGTSYRSGAVNRRRQAQRGHAEGGVEVE